MKKLTIPMLELLSCLLLSELMFAIRGVLNVIVVNKTNYSNNNNNNNNKSSLVILK